MATKNRPFKTIAVGTIVSWHYRSAIGHGTVTGVSIDWRGTPLGCAERPAYARPAGAPGTPSRPGPRLFPCRGRVAPPAADYPRPCAPALPAGQKARPPRKMGTNADNTMYSVRETDHHPGEPDVVHHSGKALTSRK